MKLTIDFETRSAADLRGCGAAAYAEHPSTEVVCLALKPSGDGGGPFIWFPPPFDAMVAGSTPSNAEVVSREKVAALVDAADTIEAHNAQFEFFVWNAVMVGRHGFKPLDPSRLRCSAAKVAAISLPRSLAEACRVSGVPIQKDAEGHRLMLRMCKPRKPRKAEREADPDWESKTWWHETPAEIVRLGEYCAADVLAEESLSSAVPGLTDAEEAVWQLDLAINARGIRVDVEAAAAITDCVGRHSASLEREFRRATGLDSPRQRDATLALLNEMGAGMEGLTAADVDGALDAEDDPAVRRILKIRKSLSRSSTAKYKALLASACADGRVRGTLMYHGAGTGRWSGRTVQPQNFPRGAFQDTEACIELFKAGDLEGVRLMYGDPMIAASTCLRGMLIPGEGMDFVVADYSSIEGRVLAWLAGERSALSVYRSGRDPYKVAASAIYGVPYEDVAPPQRQIGKVAELALGYQGAVGAFSAMARSYGLDAMPDDEIKGLVGRWRESRPMTVELWAALESAAHRAVENPGVVFDAGPAKLTVRFGFLIMRLPSGRCLWYARPRIEDKETPWGKTKPTVAIDATNAVTRAWGTSYLYGGLLAENLTQAVARDILVEGMLGVEKAGYPVVMHVHDELISEVPEGYGTVEEFEGLMCKAPEWAKGLPLKAEGWRGKRYRK